MKHRATRLGLVAVIGVMAACSETSEPGSSSTSSAPSSSTTVENSPQEVPFRSNLYPYSIVLPTGWSVLEASQLAGSDEDVFTEPDAVFSVTMGSGVPEPGQTLEDRVELGRASFPDCTSNPADDLEIEMGGERGLLWVYECGTTFHLAAQTIREGVGYRLTIHSEVEDEEAARQIMEGLLAGFAFTDRMVSTTLLSSEVATESVCGPLPPGAQDERLPWGEYQTATLPTAILRPALQARGMPDIDATLTAHDFDVASIKTLSTTFCFIDGEFSEFGSVNGGPPLLGSLGFYTLIDDQTIELSEPSVSAISLIEFELDGDILTLNTFEQQGAAGWDPYQQWFTMSPYAYRSTTSARPSICGDIPAATGSDTALPFGEYKTGPIPMAQLLTALEASGLPDVETTLRAHGIDPSSTRDISVTLCFVNGEYAQFIQIDDGANELGAIGDYTVSDKDTVDLSFPGHPFADHLEFTLDGNLLTINSWETTDVEVFTQYVLASFTASPYARQP